MATIVIKSAQVGIAGVNISTAVTQVSIDYKAEIKDETLCRIPGLKDWTVDVCFGSRRKRVRPDRMTRNVG